MQYQKIKGIEKPLSRIIYGCTTEPMMKGQNVNELLDEIYALGINTFDTAEHYGLSEVSLGKWMTERKNREDIVIITKGCHPIGGVDRLSVECVKEDIEKSIQDVLIDMPIVVLVNENSASASEILSGALKDLNEAKIVGTTTYGKGVIQELLSFRDGSGLKVTTHEYYTPNRNKINGVGIKPNELVELPKTVNSLYVTEENDTQLQKAIEILK